MNLPKTDLLTSVIYENGRDGLLRQYSVQLTKDTVLSIRSLNPHTDLPVIHKWVNMPYAIPYWQMNCSLPELEKACQEVTDSPFVHTIVACLNDQLICQLDLYDPLLDTISKYYPVETGDTGVHILMGPGKKPVPHFTAHVILTLMDFLFQSDRVNRIMAEPDERNRPANQLLEKLHYQYHSRLIMPHKTALLYSMSRAIFSQLAPVLRSKL